MPQLSGQQSITLNLIGGNTAATSIRPASYDLRIERIIKKGVSYTSDGACLHSQEVAILVSKETIEVLPGYVGYAFPKTSLCNKGVHILNTGLLDPGFKGKLSTVALNFDKNEIKLHVDEVFMRVVFHELPNQLKDPYASAQSDISLINEAENRSLRFPKSFLDIPGTVTTLTDKVLSGYRTQMIWILAIFTVVFGLWTFFGPTLSEFAPHYEAYKTNQDLEPKILELENKVHELDLQISKASAASTPPPAGSKPKIPAVKSK